MARTFSYRKRKSAAEDAVKDAVKDAPKEVKEAAKKSAPQRSKSFKKIRKAARSSIRGILTGETRKERKARKEAERKAKGGSLPPSDSDDEETVYGVNLSTPGAKSKLLSASPDQEGADDVALLPKRSPNALQIVLVLMDPTTRRFELLQLEFDSTKAIVADVLSQVPMSVTEATLREKNYTGICDRFGTEMINSLSLKEFCDGSDVVLAIPEGTSSKECARLAKPILSDPNVIRMLKSNGIDCSQTSSRAIGKKSKTLRTVVNFLLIAALAVAVKFGNDFITAPLGPGDALSPGMWRSKCGVLSFLPSQETWSKLSLPESFDPITSALSCERAGLEMSRNGVLSLSGSNGWEMEGSVCAVDHPSCVDGLTIKDNGSLVIGGKQVGVAKATSASPELSPWPFAEAPKVRVVKARK